MSISDILRQVTSITENQAQRKVFYNFSDPRQANQFAIALRQLGIYEGDQKSIMEYFPGLYTVTLNNEEKAVLDQKVSGIVRSVIPASAAPARSDSRTRALSLAQDLNGLKDPSAVVRKRWNSYNYRNLINALKRYGETLDLQSTYQAEMWHFMDRGKTFTTTVAEAFKSAVTPGPNGGLACFDTVEALEVLKEDKTRPELIAKLEETLAFIKEELAKANLF